MSRVRGRDGGGRTGAGRADAAGQPARAGGGAAGGRSVLPAACQVGAAPAAGVCGAAGQAAPRVVGPAGPAAGVHPQVGPQLPLGDADRRGAGGDRGRGAGGHGSASPPARRLAGGDAQAAAGRDQRGALGPASAATTPFGLVAAGSLNEAQDQVGHLVRRLELQEVTGPGDHLKFRAW